MRKYHEKPPNHRTATKPAMTPPLSYKIKGAGSLTQVVRHRFTLYAHTTPHCGSFDGCICHRLLERRPPVPSVTFQSYKTGSDGIKRASFELTNPSKDFTAICHLQLEPGHGSDTENWRTGVRRITITFKAAALACLISISVVE